MTVWHKIHQELWNSHFTYNQNNLNGCNLPPREGMMVWIYDSDKPRYFAGTIGQPYGEDRLIVWESIHGDVYGGVDNIYWALIDYFEDEDYKRNWWE